MGGLVSTCDTCINDYCLMKRDRDEQEQEDDVGSIEEVKKGKEKSPEKKSKILTSTSISTSEAFECSDIACFGAGCYWYVCIFISFSSLFFSSKS